jgi:indolepyruvate ferredoxin oxidoreductase alpha subunit
VQFGAWNPEEYDWEPRFDSTLGGGYIPIAETVIPKKARALNNLEILEKESEESVSNEVLAPNGTRPIKGKRLGLISASLPSMSLLENLELSNQPIDLLKLGFSYPMPKRKVAEFLKAHDEIYIVEELDRVMESEIKMLAFDEGISCRIHCKPTEKMIGELGSVDTWNLLSDAWPDVFAAPQNDSVDEKAIKRLPTFCPGCGHRAAFFSVDKVLKEQDNLPITVADIGCHTMGAFEPYKIGEILLSMGHSNGTAAGLSIGNTKRKVISFIGDSTFFHAGLPAIIDAVLYDHNFTLVVMENGTTAMTGQQPHPGSGEVGEKISIDKVLEAFGVKHVARVSAYAHDKLVAALEEAVKIEGFSVVIASHPCMLKFGRELKKKGKDFPMVMSVEEGGSLEDSIGIGHFDCPSFNRQSDGSYTINHNLCIGDGSCRPASVENKLVLKKRGGE